MAKQKRNLKKNINKKTWFIMIAAGAALCALAVVLFIFLFPHGQDAGQHPGEETSEPFMEMPEIPEIPFQKYEEPSYNFKEEVVEIVLPGISREYTLAWVSDVHMLNDTEVAEDIAEDQLETIQMRHDIAFIDENGTPSNELWPEIVKYLNYHHFDAVLFGGDIMDYTSKKNMEYMSTYYKQLREDVPILYIRADHDYGGWYSGGALSDQDIADMHAQYLPDEDSEDSRYLDMGEFALIGINRSTKGMAEWQYNWFKTRYDWATQDGKPVLIVTHVPYASQVDASLEELSYQVRNKIYYWGGGDYVPYEYTKTYLDMIYAPDTNVKQVLAGHLHAMWDGQLTEQVPQHIFSPAYTGTIGIIHIVPEDAALEAGESESGEQADVEAQSESGEQADVEAQSGSDEQADGEAQSATGEQADADGEVDGNELQEANEVEQVTAAFEAFDMEGALQAVSEPNAGSEIPARNTLPVLKKTSTSVIYNGQMRAATVHAVPTYPVPRTANAYRKLKVPVSIEKLGRFYFITDCYHDQVIYTNTLSKPIEQWDTMSRNMTQPHGIATDGKNYVVLDTENHQVKVFQYKDNGFYLAQTLEGIGQRPHDIVYDAIEKAFYVWSSTTGDMYILKLDVLGRLCVSEIRHVKELQDFYIRSFYVMGDYILFPSGTNGYMLLCKKDTLEVVWRYPVAKEIAGMADVIYIGQYFYITVSTDLMGDQSYATIIRTKDLTSLAKGQYEDVSSWFKGVQVPYYFSQIEGHYYLTNHGGKAGLYRFDGAVDGLKNIEIVY